MPVDAAPILQSIQALATERDTALKEAQAAGTKVTTLQKQYDDHMRTHEPAVPKTPDLVVPQGWKLLREFDLSKDEGWTSTNGITNSGVFNSEAKSARFTPEGMVLTTFEEGGVVYGADMRAMFFAIPDINRIRAVVSAIDLRGDAWPAGWLRPLKGQGEIDLYEWFGINKDKPNEAMFTLHRTPYSGTHADGRPNHLHWGKPAPGLRDWDQKRGQKIVIEFEKVKDRMTLWVDGVEQGRHTRAEWEGKVRGPGAWNVFEAGNIWYYRHTNQGGQGKTKMAQPFPSPLKPWSHILHELAVYGRA